MATSKHTSRREKRNRTNASDETNALKARFFLFDASVTDFADCIRLEQLDEFPRELVDGAEVQQPLFTVEDEAIREDPLSQAGRRPRRLQLSGAISRLGFEVEAWVLVKTETPAWFSFISEFVDVDDPARRKKNSEDVYGMLVLIKLRPENRIFGVSFSYGYQFVRYEKLESGFGRRIVLNTIPRDGLRTLDVHNVDLVTRHKRIQVNRRTDTSDFRLDGEDVVVTGVIGVPSSKHSLGRGQIEGTDSLAFNLKDNLTTIERKCRQLLNLYASDDFSRTFPELTRLLPISGQNRRRLDEQLFEALNRRTAENISLMVPNLDLAYGTSQFAVYDGSHEIGIRDEFELEAFYAVIDPSSHYDWANLRIGIYREGDSRPSSWFPLLKGLIYLLEERGGSFLYSFGYWYEITQDYQDRLTRKISEIDVFDGLPAMLPTQSEGEYNAAAATDLDYCLLDKKLIVLDTRNRIEAADLVTPNWEFVCVKKASSAGHEVHSSTLSHLFAQGSVSAILLSNDREYRKTLALQIKKQKQWPIPFDGGDIREREITFVYAIATSSSDQLADRLPLFSKITLLNHVEEIRKLGYQVRLCKIMQLQI